MTDAPLPKVLKCTYLPEVSIALAGTTGSFLYLNIPLHHSILYATFLTLQGFFGTYLVTSLSSRLRPSFALIFGPGLLLGGTVSFAIFQITGRGILGLASSLAACLISISLLSRSKPLHVCETFSLTPFAQILGLTALVMSSEFPWLSITAIGFFTVSVIWAVFRTSSIISKCLRAMIILITSFVAILFRGSYWWLITDDYKFFEVLSKHITRSGPTNAWGLLEILEYHWLSYGWGGMLDLAASNPPTLLTLTRVMPFVYSLIFASSLLLIVQLLSNDKADLRVICLPVWVIAANIKPDWSGTSTGGAIAVLTALVSLVIVGCDEKCRVRRIVVYGLFGLILALTKLTSLLVITPYIIGIEILRNRDGTVSGSLRQKFALAGVLSGLAVILTLEPFGKVVDGFSVSWPWSANAHERWRIFETLVAGAIQNVWIVALILVAWSLTSKGSPSALQTYRNTTLLGLSMLWPLTVLLPGLVTGTSKANLHEYLTLPTSLLVALSLLPVSPHLSGAATLSHRRIVIGSTASATLLLLVANLVGQSLTMQSSLPKSVIHQITDIRVISTLVFLILILRSRRLNFAGNTVPIAIVLIVLTLAGSQPSIGQIMDKGTRPIRPMDELNSLLGSQPSQQIGRWLKTHTAAGDLIATNALLDSGSGHISDDYSLAMWSDREFLVLGPKFFNMAEKQRDAVELSINFGCCPTEESWNGLKDLGVTWFVVDTQLTSNRSWRPFAATVFMNNRFQVLRIAS